MQMDSKESNEFVNDDWDDIVNIRQEYKAAVKIENMELILQIVGSFGKAGGLSDDILSKHNGNINFFKILIVVFFRKI